MIIEEDPIYNQINTLYQKVTKIFYKYQLMNTKYKIRML